MPIVCCWRHDDPNRGKGEFGGGRGIQRVQLVTQLAGSVLNMQSRDLKKCGYKGEKYVTLMGFSCRDSGKVGEQLQARDKDKE